MSDLPYRTMPDPPERMGAGAALARVCDSLGFRLHWATEGLRGQDVDFAPVPEAMSIRQVVEHIFRILSFTRESLGVGGGPGTVSDDFTQLRGASLDCVAAIRDRLAEMSDDEVAAIRLERGEHTFPVWNMIHGPLTDALTHVGQINTARRMSGNPVKKVNYLRGEVN